MFSTLSKALSVLVLVQLISAEPSRTLQSRAPDVSNSTVDLGYAQYQGTFDPDTNITTFFGIRYAEAPVGDLRWQPPQTPTYTAGVQQATAQPNECYQASLGNLSTNPYRESSLQKRAVSQSEDCLFLNIYTPGPLNSSAGLPVLVWIHGGGYVFGSASAYTGQDIIKESGFGVITVIIQYRLGVFGFLSGSEVKENGTLNAGLLDQNFALQWVQEHVAAFGGDPANVTIWGESAGAGSVLQHVVAHGGQTEPPLFRAAMTSSTFLPLQYYYNDTIPETVFSETVAQSNCSSASDALACLRSTDVSVLQEANVNISSANFYGTFTFVPVVDGTFIVERPTVTLERRRVNGEVLLSVTNSYEGSLFVNTAPPPTNITTYVSQLFPLFDEVDVQAVVQQYASDTSLTDVLAQAIAIIGESIIICPTYLLLEAFGSSAYKGEFAIPPAYHGQDMEYYFPTANPPTYNNTAFITSFSQSFTSVAHFLDPNVKVYPDLKPSWSVWEDGATEMLFNVTTTGEPAIGITTTDPALLERCAFWQGMSSLTNQ